jgi:hypothetical protein
MTPVIHDSNYDNIQFDLIYRRIKLPDSHVKIIEHDLIESHIDFIVESKNISTFLKKCKNLKKNKIHLPSNHTTHTQPKYYQHISIKQS